MSSCPGKIVKAKPPEQKTPEKKGRRTIPKTPEHYWDTTFPSYEEQLKRGYLEVATSPWKPIDGIINILLVNRSKIFIQLFLYLLRPYFSSGPYKNKKFPLQEEQKIHRIARLESPYKGAPEKPPKRIRRDSSDAEWYSKKGFKKWDFNRLLILW